MQWTFTRLGRGMQWSFCLSFAMKANVSVTGAGAIDGRGALNVDYMEKSTVRFWSAVQLKRACGNQAGIIQCRNRSHPTHQEQLRGTFRHRLRIVISEFPTEFAAASVDAAADDEGVAAPPVVWP